MAIVKGDRIGESQRLNRCSPEAQDFYAAMIAAEVPDDFGRFRDTAQHVWIRMYPRREPTPSGLRRVRRLMAELVAAGLWRTWSVDGVGFAELYNTVPRGNLLHRTPEPPPDDKKCPHVHTKRCATTALARAKEWGDASAVILCMSLLKRIGPAEPEQSPNRVDSGTAPARPEQANPRASVRSVRSVRSTDTDLSSRQAEPNPLVDRAALVREGYALVTAIAGAENIDPTEVARKATQFKGHSYVRLDTLTDDRLAHSVATLRSWSRRLCGEPEPKPLAEERAPPTDNARQTITGWLEKSGGGGGSGDVRGRVVAVDQESKRLRDGGADPDVLGGARAARPGPVGPRGTDGA